MSGILVDPHFMAAQATHLHRGVNRLALGLVRMTLEALGCIHVRLEGDRMFRGGYRPNLNDRYQANAENLAR